jgi:hypothetical protein
MLRPAPAISGAIIAMPGKRVQFDDDWQAIEADAHKAATLVPVTLRVARFNRKLVYPQIGIV